MDPNANRIEQLQIARQIVDDAENHTYGAVRLAELVIALDEWMQSGGFIPEAWLVRYQPKRHMGRRPIGYKP